MEQRAIIKDYNKTIQEEYKKGDRPKTLNEDYLKQTKARVKATEKMIAKYGDTKFDKAFMDTRAKDIGYIVSGTVLAGVIGSAAMTAIIGNMKD